MPAPKIAIAGKMAAGKSYLAAGLQDTMGFEIYSLAGKVKDIAYDLFKMDPEHKDRPLLQGIGMKMRELQPDVWINYILEEAKKSTHPVVCDDVRFVNEAKQFKEAGWILIKIDIDDDLQLSRLQSTYPDNWNNHWSNRDDPSEAEVNQIPEDLFDLILTASNDDIPFGDLMTFIWEDESMLRFTN